MSNSTPTANLKVFVGCKKFRDDTNSFGHLNLVSFDMDFR